MMPEFVSHDPREGLVVGLERIENDQRVSALASEKKHPARRPTANIVDCLLPELNLDRVGGNVGEARWRLTVRGIG